VARTLALAHKVDEMIRAGELRDLADAARAIGVSRARMTQIMKLLLLAPEIQEAILDFQSVTERQLRRIVAEPGWQRQLELWNEVKP
jgi:ParB-like chromosome segregation protein Spo0J